MAVVASLSTHLLRPFSLLVKPTHLSLYSSKPFLSLQSLRPILSLSTSHLPPHPEINENGDNIIIINNNNVQSPNGDLFNEVIESYSETEKGFLVSEINENGESNNNVKLPNEKSLESEIKEESGNNNNNNVKLVKKDIGWVKLPSLSVKEKKEIGSYAHSLGKKLKSQQVGKGGVTEAVGVALVESLEKNELLKIKIHNNCPGEIDDNVKRLEELTGSVVVGQIGRTVILYRPSMTKLKAEEKRKHAEAVVSRRRQAFKSSSENRGLQSKENGRGRRGSSRYSTPS